MTDKFGQIDEENQFERKRVTAQILPNRRRETVRENESDRQIVPDRRSEKVRENDSDRPILPNRQRVPGLPGNKLLAPMSRGEVNYWPGGVNL